MVTGRGHPFSHTNSISWIFTLYTAVSSASQLRRLRHLSCLRGLHKLVCWLWFTGCLLGGQNTFVNTCEPTEAGGFDVRGHLWLNREFKVNLSYMRPCL